MEIHSPLLIGHGLLGNAVARLAAETGLALRVADLPDVDITDAASVDRLVACAKPDAIILTAAYTRVDDCETNADLAIRVNADGAANVARVAAKVGARLIYYSTDYVFDGEKGTPYVEDDPPNPLSVYGRSKLAGERSVADLATDFTIIRTASMFGVGGANFVSTILEKFDRGEALRVVGDQTMSPTYNVDLARATFELMKLDLTGVFHVANTGALTWYEWAGMIAERAGYSKAEIVPVAAADLARPARRPTYSALSCAKMVKFGAAATHYASDALGRFLSELKRGR